MNFEAAELLTQCYHDPKVMGSSNQAGVVANILLATLIVEIRKLNKQFGVPE